MADRFGKGSDPISLSKNSDYSKDVHAVQMALADRVTILVAKV